MESTYGSADATADGESEAEDPETAEKQPEDESVDELTEFRQQWQRELTLSTAGTKTASKSEVEHNLTDDEKAKQLFLRGVELERSGKLYEAIQEYKRAMQIVPDVETRIYNSIDHRDSPEVEVDREEIQPNARLSDDEDAMEGEDLLGRLQRIVNRTGLLCQPQYSTKTTHLSDLPAELVCLILRWVVSSDLDVMSLETVAACCRGLYVAARESALWRDICRRTWGMECGSPRSAGYQSWRHMFVERPRLHPHGCYISKTTYLRHGENSFQDHFYRPWYLVDYYRYLRFFPDGMVLMWTTPEEPSVSVSQLRGRTVRPGLGIMSGHYRLSGDKVAVVVKKCVEKKAVVSGNTRFRARRKEGADSHEQTFHCEFTLRRVRSRRNHQLSWTRYAVSTHPRRDHSDQPRDQWTHFDLSPAKFPPFHFSRVLTYSAEASQPLSASTT